jgi:hypothetical protein
MGGQAGVVGLTVHVAHDHDRLGAVPQVLDHRLGLGPPLRGGAVLQVGGDHPHPVAVDVEDRLGQAPLLAPVVGEEGVAPLEDGIAAEDGVAVEGLAAGAALLSRADVGAQAGVHPQVVGDVEGLVPAARALPVDVHLLEGDHVGAAGPDGLGQVVGVPGVGVPGEDAQGDAGGLGLRRRRRRAGRGREERAQQGDEQDGRQPMWTRTP